MGKKPSYTKKDMRKLAEMSTPASIPAVYLPELAYDSAKFCQLLKDYKQFKSIHALFEIPLEEVPLLVNDPEYSGYLKFRLEIGK